MRAAVIEVVAPGNDHAAGMANGVEQVLIEAFVTHPANEAFHEPVLHWLSSLTAFAGKHLSGSGSDVVPFDVALLLPFQDGTTGQLGAVVTDHHAGIAKQFSNPVQFAHNANA